MLPHPPFASPDRTSCADLCRETTPLRSLAEPSPEPLSPCAALLPAPLLFPSLSPESSFHANMATATSTAFHAVARRLPRSTLVLHRPDGLDCTGRMDCSEREGETLRTGQRQRTESQAIIVRRPRTPALAQLHSVQIQNGGVPSNEPE